MDKEVDKKVDKTANSVRFCPPFSHAYILANKKNNPHIPHISHVKKFQQGTKPCYFCYSQVWDRCWTAVAKCQLHAG